MPGYDVAPRPDGSRCAPGDAGAMCVFSAATGRLADAVGDDARFEASYLWSAPGTTSPGTRIPRRRRYLYVLGRIDDVQRRRASPVDRPHRGMVAAHPAVTECAVIGVADEDQGRGSARTRRLKRGAGRSDGLAEALIAAVRSEIGASGLLRKQVDVVPALPKTRSGKILQKTMRDITQAQRRPMPSTIEDPKVLQLIRPILQP